AAEHAHPLPDSDDAEPPALRCSGECMADLESGAVVRDPNLDRASACAKLDGDLRRAGVLTDVRERLLHRAEQRDALRGAQRLRVALDLETCLYTAAFRERIDLAVKDLAERPADDALRLQ